MISPFNVNNIENKEIEWSDKTVELIQELKNTDKKKYNKFIRQLALNSIEDMKVKNKVYLDKLKNEDKKKYEDYMAKVLVAKIEELYSLSESKNNWKKV